MRETFYVIAGGTFMHVAPHFALAAPAFGTVGRQLAARLVDELDDAGHDEFAVRLLLTRMALGGNARDEDDVRLLDAAGLKDLVTNEDLEKLLAFLTAERSTRCIVLAAAVCDFEPISIEPKYKDADGVGKDAHPRLSSSHKHTLEVWPAKKLLGGIRRERKDIFLVAFKTTAGETPERTYARGLKLLKETSSNVVLANDIRARTNVIVTPEEFPYRAPTRDAAVGMLAEMIAHRTLLHFVRTEVRPGERADPLALEREGAVPSNFIEVLRHLFARGAYKRFLGKTTGHFGCKVEGKPFARISSCRKEDHTLSLDRGMAKIYGYENGVIVAEGGRPSVGEHTQHRIYEEIGEGADAIVHFHSPLKAGSAAVIPTASQFRFECGSQECGENTATHIREIVPGIWCVHLEGHGPNIAFSRHVPSGMIISFIEKHFDLDDKTGGVLPEHV